MTPATAQPGGQDRIPDTAARWSVERYKSHGWALGAYFIVPASGPHDRSITVRIGHRSWTLHRDRDGQPWPEVPECFGQHHPHHVCPQHDPAHEHTWQAGKPFRPGGMIPVRCVVCGGRKCDRPRCIRLRHHSEDHSDWLGYNGAVVNV